MQPGIFSVLRLARLCLIVFFAATSPAFAAERPIILTTIAQLGEPLGRIFSGCARVETLLGTGIDPHLYRLNRTDVAKALKADVIVANGLNLEAQMLSLFERLSTTRPVIFAAELLSEIHIIRPDGRSADPHIWMDPNLWAAVLGKTSDELVKIWPRCKPTVTNNKAIVIAQIEAVDQYGKSRVASIPEQARILITAHDAFGYFGRRYDLTVLSVQGLSTESEAGIAHIRDLVSIIAGRKVGAVFVETSAPERSVDAVIEGARALGAAVEKGSPLFSDAMGSSNTYEGTYVGMIDHNITTIVRGLGGEAPITGMQKRLAVPPRGES
jgi:manganese/zinc/iron transport system substrate-binding protein